MQGSWLNSGKKEKNISIMIVEQIVMENKIRFKKKVK